MSPISCINFVVALLTYGSFLASAVSVILFFKKLKFLKEFLLIVIRTLKLVNSGKAKLEEFIVGGYWLMLGGSTGSEGTGDGNI